MTMMMYFDKMTEMCNSSDAIIHVNCFTQANPKTCVLINMLTELVY